MGYSIHEGVSDAERRLAFFRTLAETYPDAYQEGERWVSETLRLEDCDGFAIETETRESGSTLTYVRFYRTLGEGAVYSRWLNRVLLDVFFHDLKTKDLAFYTVLLNRLKERRA